MKLFISAMAIAGALALTGCSAAAPVGNAATSAPPAAVTSAPTVASASASQYASIISEHEQDWRDYSDGAQECVSASYDESALGQAKQTACGYRVRTIAITAKTASKDLTALDSPPAEVASLVSRTVGVLDLIDEADADVACETGTTEECGVATMSTNIYARELTSILDAWKPYTG